MYINSPEINQTDDDDLFTRPPRSARRMPVIRQARRACVVCQASYMVALDYDGPPLCEECRSDLDATRARVQAWIDGVDDQEGTAWREWEATAARYVDFWAKIVTARVQRGPGADEAARKAHPDYALILDAEATYVRATQALAAERARLTRAMQDMEGI
jgi:hypothetical protein